MLTSPEILIKPNDKICTDGNKKLSTNNKLIANEYNTKYTFLNDDDISFINSLSNVNYDDLYQQIYQPDTELSVNKQYLTINDILNLNDLSICLYDLLKNSEIILPEYKRPERNPELEERCVKLRKMQENLYYKNMTRNVAGPSPSHYEDAMGFQIKQLNKELIAVLYCIVSVVAGFAFGFVGLEYMVGKISIELKLFYGILIAFLVGGAEFYFLIQEINNVDNIVK